MSQVTRSFLPAAIVAASVLVVPGSSSPVLAAPADPVATISAASSRPLVGDDVSFSLTFDNDDLDETGFGPYLDVVFDSGGSDGDDGVSFGSASYLGASLVPLAVFDCTGTARIHPLTGATLPCQVGSQIVVLQLPFGSFTPGQPVANVDVVAGVSDLADAGFDLDVSVTPGFAYGNSATGDTPIIGATTTTTLTPELVRFAKSYVGAEEETATGPNFPREYNLDVDIATGISVTGLTITDRLPPQYAYLSATPSAPGTTNQPPVGIPSDPPFSVLSHVFSGTVVGGAGAIDASLVVDYFVSEFDTSASPVIDPASGDDVLTVNDGEASGTVVPLDTRDAPTPFVFDTAPVDPANDDDASVVAKSIAVQKSVAIVVDVGDTGPTPGDTLEYTISGQVSDYFTFGDVVVDDVLGDGQTYDAGYAPTLSITESGASSSASLAGHVIVDTSERTLCGDGTTAIGFSVSDADAAASGNGILTGGRVEGATTGPATFEITFRAVIDDAYTCTVPDTPFIDPNDTVRNDVTVTGEVYDNAGQVSQTTPRFESDGSATTLTVPPIQVEKSTYARNGVVGTPVQFAAGDLITYRLQLRLPTSDFSDLELADYLPLPVLTATALTQGADCDLPTDTPVLDQWCYGPDDTLHDAAGFTAPSGPNVDAVANSITWDFGTQEFTDNLTRSIDLLFTLEISDEPFRDGLFLTNQVQVTEENSVNDPAATPAIVQIQLTEPVLNIRKGAVAASTQTPAATFTGSQNPTGVVFDAVTTAGACPDFTGSVTSTTTAGGAPDANVSGLDRDDLVRFAIVVENTGSGLNGAFDVAVSDVIPAGFELPAGGPDLCVTDGAGTVLAATPTGFLADVASTTGTITLADGPSTGALAPFHPTSGANLAVITYTLQLVDTIGANAPASELTNTATITKYSASDGGPTFVPVTPASDLTDSASAATKPLTIGKQLTATSQPSTTGTSVAIGEEVQYTVTVTVPEGLSRAVTLVDTLDAGLEISRTPTAAVLGTDLSASGVTAPTISPDRRVLTYGFGDITNSNSDNATAVNETITFTYWAVVTNVAANQRGSLRRNSAVVGYRAR